MVALNYTLVNFPQQDALLSIFGKYTNNFEYTVNGIFRRTMPPFCQSCGAQMTYNSYNKLHQERVRQRQSRQVQVPIL